MEWETSRGALNKNVVEMYEFVAVRQEAEQLGKGTYVCGSIKHHPIQRQKQPHTLIPAHQSTICKFLIHPTPPYVLIN